MLIIIKRIQSHMLPHSIINASLDNIMLPLRHISQGVAIQWVAMKSFLKFPELKEELHNRFNSISEERVKNFKHNSENLMKIG